MSSAAEYECAFIETIARGVAISDGRILLCKAKGGSSTYLPGGHIELGESGREALVREMKEETGLDVSTGSFLGVVENSFLQKGKRHSEINLVYEMAILPNQGAVAAAEDWIEFEWRDLADIESVNLLPEAFRVLGKNPHATFEP